MGKALDGAQFLEAIDQTLLSYSTKALIKTMVDSGRYDLPDPPASVADQEEYRMDELAAVMQLGIDKWLEGDELKNNPATRAADAREKVLRIIENLEEQLQGALTKGAELVGPLTAKVDALKKESAEWKASAIKARKITEEIDAKLEVAEKQYTQMRELFHKEEAKNLKLMAQRNRAMEGLKNVMKYCVGGDECPGKDIAIDYLAALEAKTEPPKDHETLRKKVTRINELVQIGAGAPPQGPSPQGGEGMKQTKYLDSVKIMKHLLANEDAFGDEMSSREFRKLLMDGKFNQDNPPDTKEGFESLILNDPFAAALFNFGRRHERQRGAIQLGDVTPRV